MGKISEKLKAKIRRQAKNRCGYCLLPQSLNPNLLELEHLLATAKGGTDDEENLWLACRAMVTKERKLKRLMMKLIKSFYFSIRELKIGTSILSGAKKELSAKLLVVGQLSKP